MSFPTRRQLLRDGITVAALISFPEVTEAFAFADHTEVASKPMNKNAFVHPGMLHSAADLRFLHEKLQRKEEPWKSAWEKLKADKIADSNVAPHPVARVFRGPYNKPDIGSSALGHDSGAAYTHALIGALSPDATESMLHFTKAVEILDAWAGTLESIDGHDQKLLCGLTGYRFINAAELVRHSGIAPVNLWPDARIAAFDAMLGNVFYPPIRSLFPEANGNWDAAMICTLLCIAIFREDRALFDRTVDDYLHSGGNGSITHYIYPSGQSEETTRDQGHVQLGMGMLATACQIAGNQGVDLYSAANNRLALGFEYMAKYNLGEDVLCDAGVPGPQSRGKFQPIYESVYRHYAVEKKLPMPYTARVLAQIRPEGYDGSHPGWGTLTNYRGTARVADSEGVLQTAYIPSGNGIKTPSPDGFIVTSPSRNLQATIGVVGGKLTYSLRDSKGKPLILPSVAGIEFEEGVPALDGNFAIWESTEARRELPRTRLWGAFGEQNATNAPRLPFQERQLTLRENTTPHRVLRVELRVYDTGTALRLVLPPNRDAATQAKTAREKTTFVFPESALAYESYAHEDEFRPVALSALKPGNWLPFTVRIGNESGPHFSLMEIDETNRGTPQTLLSPLPTVKNAVCTEARGPVTVGTEVSTAFPWRVVLVGQSPAQLAESGRLIPSLWPESVLPVRDTGWIRPGKTIREATLSTPGGIACIDFAVQNGLQYILYDAGWYGSEYDDASDARHVSLDPKRVNTNHPGLDLPRVIAYGKEKGIGVFLYVNRRALEKQLPELAPLYESWGVAGIKFGFVNVGPEEWTRWIRDSIALCAKHHLLVDIHDAYRPVGVSGTYPNLLTQEGIRGNEHMPTPRHNCTLPFTRFLSGPADYTICYRNSRLQTTDAHQMALSVLYFSPFQLLYWYGQPKDYAGLPELEFFKAVPTVWDETRWLGGEIGAWAAVARRSGRDWFLGAITNESARDISLKLDFLPAGMSYTLKTYTDRRDSVGKPEPTFQPGVSRIDIRTDIVSRGKLMSIHLVPAGGIALQLTPRE